MRRGKARQDQLAAGFGDLAGADLFADACLPGAPETADRDRAEQGAADEPAPHFHNHRWRLRERFLSAGPGSLADYEMLELVLFRKVSKTQCWRRDRCVRTT